MMHTIEVDSTTRNGRKIMEQVRSMRTGVREKSPIVNGVPPEGYFTEEEFIAKTDEIIKRRCEEYGII